MSSAPGQLPPPWRIDLSLSGYIIRDANGRDLARVPFRHDEAEAMKANVLTYNEARVIAEAIARIPELFGAARGGSR